MPSAARNLAERVLRVRELGIVAALALLIGVTAILEPRFIEADSLRNLALNASILAILAVGQTLVIITRNVDLSTRVDPGAERLSRRRPALQQPGDVAAARLPTGHGPRSGGLRPVQRHPRDLGPGPCAGGHARNALRLPRAGLPVDRRPPGQRRNAARSLSSIIGSESVAGIPILAAVRGGDRRGFWSGNGCATIGPGRELYAIGSIPEGARLAGVRSGRRVLVAFLLSGALSGLGGVLFTARLGPSTLPPAWATS